MIRLKKNIITLFAGIIFFLGFQIPYEAENTTSVVERDGDLCDLDNTSFLGGEELVYQIYYNWKFIWIPAGEVKFTAREIDDRYLLSVRGKTFPSYDSFFKVDDDYYSEVDKETLLPYMFRRDIEQGNYFRYDSIVFDQDKQQLIEYYGKTKEKAIRNPLEFTTGVCTQDLVSMLYHLRNRDISDVKKGEKFPIHLFFDKDLYNLELEFKKRAVKKIKDLGKYKVMHIRPKLIAGEVFNDEAHMDIWVSDDANRIPLLIQSAVTLGSVKAVLKSHKGLKYELQEK